MKLSYQSGYIKALDGFRGIAILLILVFHHYEYGPFRNITAIGWIGVDLFFVLSGFLITGILIDSLGSNNYYRVFIIRRCLRIFPLYYLILFLFFAFARLIDFNNTEYLLNHQGYFWTYTQNFLIAFKGWPRDFSGLNHFWSLAIEEQFYLLWPIVILKFNSKRVIALCVLLIFLCIIIRNIEPSMPFAYVNTFARLDGLLIGSIGAILMRKNKKWLERWIIQVSTVVSILFICMIYISRENLYLSNENFIRFGYTVIAILFGSLLILSFAENSIGRSLRRFLSTEFLTFFGRYSYGLYVYHNLLHVLLYGVILDLLATHSLPHEGVLTSSIILFITISVSYVSYHLFEKKFLKLKEKFYYDIKAL